jgi:hypothetical protein
MAMPYKLHNDKWYKHSSNDEHNPSLSPNIVRPRWSLLMRHRLKYSRHVQETSSLCDVLR